MSGLKRSKSGIEDRGRDLFKRGFSMIFTITLFSVFILLFFAATATPASAAQHTLEGYTLEPQEKWTTGNIKGWAEGECIPFRYTLKNTGGSPESLNIKLKFDYIDNGRIGIVDFESFNTSLAAGTIDGPYFEGDIGYYWWNVTIPGGTTYILEWCARLSNEAGLWPGASMQVYAENGGSRTVSILTGFIKIPDLYVTKTADVSCDAISYTINYGNSGDANQTNTTLVDDYDETNVTVTDAGGGTDNGNNITWSIGIVVAGGTGNVSYTVNIKEGVANGTEIINSGTISGDLAEEVITNNYYSVTSYAKVSPTATAGSNSPVCVGDTIELYGGPEGMSSYSWTGPDGWASNVQNPTRPDATLAMAGGYTLTVTDANGCTDSATTTVVVYSKPTATAGSNSPVCVGDTIELYGGPEGMSSYSWTGPGGWTSNEQNPTRPDATLAMAGGYTLTVTDANGCTDSATTTVVVYSKPTATAGSNSPVCVGDTIELYGGPEGMSSYSWTGPGGWTSNEQNPTRPDATLAMAGGYTLTVTDANGCTDSATTTVVVYSKPTATAGSNSPVCVGDTIELYGGPEGMSSYSWTGPGGWASNEQNPTRPDATLAMAGEYTLTVTDTHGCTDSATTTVVVYSKPTATAGSNSPVCVGDTIELYGGPEGMSSYSWTGPGGWASNEQNPTRPDATLAMAGEYTLTVTDANGCTDSATTTVVVYSKPKPKPPFPLITPPQQPQYFTEKSSVQGEGEFRIEKKIVDNAIAIDVHELIHGNGSFAMESKERLNESATNRSIEDNYEHTKMIQFDSGVMIGTARYSSSFQGGTGPSVEEFFAVTEMQKTEDVSIYTTADVGDKQVLDFDTMDEFEGTWGTRAEWSKPCKKKIELEQTFDGDFAIQKELVFEEKVTECKKDC